MSTANDNVDAAAPAEMPVNKVPKWLQCWQSKEEKENPEQRQRWMGRCTFILAAVGSAIGLGNFWRFPYLTYKHGGAYFFFPWASCLVLMGIPFMIMELALGQKFQRGDIAVFRGINKNLAGIGVISVYSSYVFSFYYNVIVAWALVYVVGGCMSPLPWSASKKDGKWPCNFNADGTEKDLKISRAEQFFNLDVTRQVDENCVKWDDSQPVVMSWNAFGSTFAVWIIIFLCVFKGVGSSSYIVWATVPLPVTFVLIMIINGSTLDGASDGIKKYFSGGLDEDGKAMVTTAAMQWSDAAGQIFLGLSVCLGIMTSYGSYNDKKKPIILDSVIISVCNCSFSFVAGFAVWSVVGYLEKAKLMHKTKTSGVGLAFISYPTAIDTMSVPNLWAFLLGMTLFMLGIDSSFSAIEATSTVICDTAWGGVVPRMFVAFVLCVIGFLGSIPFCFNWGFTLFDVVDHYLCAYLLLIIGILQAFGCGWFFDAAQCIGKSEGHKKSIWILALGYWIPLAICGIVSVLMGDFYAGFGAFFCIFFLMVVPASYMMVKDNLSFIEYYNEIFLCGVRRISYACSQMSRTDPKVIMWWEPIFCVYWSWLIKFINPAILWFMLIGIMKDDIGKAYGGYSIGWQAVGWAIPIIGFLLFVVSFFFPDHTELDYSEFELAELADDVPSNKVAAEEPAADDVQKPNTEA